MKISAIVERVEVQAYAIPTEQPESDGTHRWDSTTLVVVHLHAGGARGLGYTYADAATAGVVRERLAAVVTGTNALDIASCRSLMVASLRNLGADGIGMLAVSAVDNALWDLKARLLEVPLVDLLGAARRRVAIYGSGGFTSYTVDELQRQLAGWVERGTPRVKMKIGRDAAADPERVKKAREAVGPGAELYVDANGGYSRKQALAMAQIFARYDVAWFEEPVVHHDREGLRLLRDRTPPGMEVSAGEYGFTLGYLHQLLQEGAVDVLQADASRCGISGFLAAAALCVAYHIPLSSHCAPALHLHPCCAAGPVRHLEYFHDHVRIEQMLFDGVVEPVEGALAPDRGRPGIGLELREAAAGRYKV